MKSLIIYFLILLTFTSFAQNRIIENKSGGYSISVPGSWTEKTDGTTTDAYPPEEGDLDVWTEFIGVSVAEANGLSLDEAFQYYITQDFPSYYSSFTIVKKGEEVISGLKARWVLYSFSNTGASNDALKSATLYTIFYLIHKKDFLYSINGISEKSHYPTYEKDFLSVARSFRITP
jgi:hypothetical protein